MAHLCHHGSDVYVKFVQRYGPSRLKQFTCTQLMLACRMPDGTPRPEAVEVVRLLLAAGTDINFKHKITIGTKRTVLDGLMFRIVQVGVEFSEVNAELIFMLVASGATNP